MTGYEEKKPQMKRNSEMCNFDKALVKVKKKREKKLKKKQNNEVQRRGAPLGTRALSPTGPLQ